MPKLLDRFDTDVARDSWDEVADVYTAGQASGRDYYRFEFFGPEQVLMCGEVSGLRLLDVGCGSGYFAREMAQRGAQVTAIDISQRMIALARGTDRYAIDYRLLDAQQLGDSFPHGSFDMVTSCVSLCDMPDPLAVIRGIHSVLRPDGRLVFSITHPCTDTPFRKWERDDAGRKQWLCIDRYFERGAYEYSWSWDREFTTPGLHATLEDWITWILEGGFQLRGFREPRPSLSALSAHPDLEDAGRVPYFVIFDVARMD